MPELTRERLAFLLSCSRVAAQGMDVTLRGIDDILPAREIAAI